MMIIVADLTERQIRENKGVQKEVHLLQWDFFNKACIMNIIPAFLNQGELAHSKKRRF